MLDVGAVVLIVVLHFGLLIYLIGGGFLALIWRRTIVPHVLMTCWAVITSFYNVACPVTMLEDHFRRRAGLPVLDGGFVESYVVSAGAALGSLNLLRLMTFSVVVLSWLLFTRSVVRDRRAKVASGRPAPDLAAAEPSAPGV